MTTTKTNDDDTGHSCPACWLWARLAGAVRDPLPRSLILEALLDAVEAIRAVDRLADEQSLAGFELPLHETEATVGDTVEELVALVELLNGPDDDHDDAAADGVTMPPGRYWVGDLCYVLQDEWGGSCGKPDGVHALPDGRRVAMFSTIHGDGTYFDEQGREYAVDSGSLGCILAADIGREDAYVNLGAFVTVAEPFTPARIYPEGSSPRSDAGVLELAGVRIHLDTDDDA
jgi:hypothetical protein